LFRKVALLNEEDFVMKKERFDPFEKAKENRKALSDEHRKRYEAGDGKAIFEFIQIDETNVKEPWVLNEIIGWVKERNAKQIAKLAKTFEKECYTNLQGRERDEVERNLSLLSLVREIEKETGWSEGKTVEVLWDIYQVSREERDPDKAVDYAKGEYREIPIKSVRSFLNMDLSTVKGKSRRPVADEYFKDLIQKRLKKYSRIFPYHQI
jgi:hypothetical protein